jgi:hypothetical protein
MNELMIWGFHSSGYIVFYVLVYNAMPSADRKDISEKHVAPIFRDSPNEDQHRAGSKWTCFKPTSFLAYSSTLKMEVTCSYIRCGLTFQELHSLMSQTVLTAHILYKSNMQNLSPSQ